MLTPATFVAAFPMFADVPVADIQRHLDASVSEGAFDVAVWGSLYDRGLGNWVAHRIVTEAVDTWQMRTLAGDRPGLAAPGDREVVMKQVDTTVVSYSAFVLKDQVSNPILRTTFGQRYRQLMRVAAPGGIAV